MTFTSFTSFTTCLVFDVVLPPKGRFKSAVFLQILTSVKRLQTSVTEDSAPTFLGNTAVCVTMASWLLWT